MADLAKEDAWSSAQEVEHLQAQVSKLQGLLAGSEATPRDPS